MDRNILTLWYTKSRRAQNVDDFETWVEGGVMPTLNAFDNGDIRTTILILDGTRVNDVRVYDDEIVPTIISRWGTGGGNVPAIFPIQDGREMDKKQNGLGVGSEDDPMYTLDRTGGQSVAFAIQGTVIGRKDTAGPQGKGFGEDGDPMYTIDTVGGHGVATDTVVRRITPLECERLQGFPDGWTDDQSDSTRYKQLGNAVTVNVARWIGTRL